MAIIGYVSDENYLAIADVTLEFILDGKVVGSCKSYMSGAVDIDLKPGDYRLTLGKPGYGAKHVDITLPVVEPIKFRLLSDKLVGYMWPKWSVSGEQSTIRINSATACRVELFKYGWEKKSHGVVTVLDEHGPRAMIQMLPDTDFTQTGVQFNKVGFPNPLMTWRLTAPQESGLYYIHLKNEGGEFFSMPWVVAPKKPRAKIAVLAATNNWNAYNNFGGRSNYINDNGLPDKPTINSRQDLARYLGTARSQMYPNDTYPPLSFERPEPHCMVFEHEQVTGPMIGRMASTLAPGMWRLLGWLEREGYEYDVYSDAQLRDGTLDLDQYKTLLTEMHPEYWYREEYIRVRDWVFNRGGRFMYLGGNGIDCEVEFVDDTKVRYLTDHNGAGTDMDVWLNGKERKYDNRFHKTFESPAPLVGVIFDHVGEGTSAPYKVTNAKHWIFKGTGLRDGDLFGEKTLHERVPGGASGHETDKRTPNTGEGFIGLAMGQNPGENAGAEMVYKDFPGNGGEVFSTGSITYISALLVDEKVSRITKNVLDHFLRN